MKTFKGKAIYAPAGKAQEYAPWACNLYKHCKGGCTYCFLNKGIGKKTLGAGIPVLKDCFKSESHAKEIFTRELKKNLPELQKHGLFFEFINDFWPETTELLQWAIETAYFNYVPVKLLTKQTEWITDHLISCWRGAAIAFGFTLTGHDELEPGCATNQQRIDAMKMLHEAGFKTWASIEPIIDIHDSAEVIVQTILCCDLYKIGLQSGGKYVKTSLIDFIVNTNRYANTPIYWKDSILKVAGIDRKDLPANCVNRDFNIFKP